MSIEVAAATDYNCNMYIYLDVTSFNAIYANGRNEIHIQVKYDITIAAGADSTVVPTEGNASVTLVNYNGGAKIPCTDNEDVEGTGWKYKTTKGDYVNAFAPQAGAELDGSVSSRSRSPGPSKDGDDYILRDFYLYNDMGSSDGLEVAATLTWKDPNGKSHTWNTTDTGVGNDNDPGFVSIVAEIPKIYDNTNTNGSKLDSEEEGGGQIGGAYWYQANYFFKITDARFKIKNTSINMNSAGDNPGGDTQGYACAVYKSGSAHYYYYIWDFGGENSMTADPIGVSLEYNERSNQLCISKVKVTNYSKDGDGWDCQPIITIYDDYGNAGTFHIQKIGTGDSIQLA